MALLLAATLVSLAIALIMSFVAWRLVRDERRRSQARVETLAAAIQGESQRAARTFEVADLERGPATTIGSDLFAAAPPARGARRMALVAAVGVLVVGSGVAVAVLSSGSETEDAAISAPVPTANAPLELVALSHEREGNRLTVRGVVRNPDGVGSVEGLTAVVLVFNREGGFVGSSRTSIESPSLPSGAESGFVVAVPEVNDVGRYRVSFRTADHVVPHVDRRNNRSDRVEGS